MFGREPGNGNAVALSGPDQHLQARGDLHWCEQHLYGREPGDGSAVALSGRQQHLQAGREMHRTGGYVQDRRDVHRRF